LSATTTSSNHLLIHLQANGHATSLLEQGWRLASALDIAFTVAVTQQSVDHPGVTEGVHSEFSNELRAAIDLAARAGGTVLTAEKLSHDGDAATLVATLKRHAQNNHARIVLTHEPMANSKNTARDSLATFKRALAEALPGLTLHVMPASQASGHPDHATDTLNAQLANAWRDAPAVLAVLVVCSLLGVALQTWFEPAILIMVYLTGVVYVALKKSRQAALVTVFAGVLLYDLLLMAPSNSALRSQSHYVLVSIVMLLVGLLISHLAAQVRRQGLGAEARDQRSQALNSLTSALVQARTSRAIGTALAQAVHHHLQASALLFAVDASGRALQRPQLESELAQVHELDEDSLFPAARAYALKALHSDSTTDANGAAAPNMRQCLLLRAASKPLAVLVINQLERATLTPEEQALLESFAQQSAVALERSLFEQRSASAAIEAESERLRNTLLTAVSHDLRTPLTTIVGSVTSLLEQSHAINEEERGALLRSVLAQARHLHALTSDILDLAQLQHGAVKLQTEWCPADELVEEARAAAAMALKTRQVDVHVPDNLVVWCDARLLGQALFNLLDNAGRHTPSSAKITVSAQRENGVFHWVVQDDGPGIAPGAEGEVFKKFSRSGGSEQTKRVRDGASASASKNTNTSDGTGLGLAICAAVAQLHGGSITATSAPGARFQLSLPQPAAPVLSTLPFDTYSTFA
jgi:two-component system, OmpR family, sensor histidine kinase KdpD